MVVTHDLAFGRSAIRAGTSFIGIIYLRPGHISAAFVLAVIDALRDHRGGSTAVHCCRLTSTIRGLRAGANSAAAVARPKPCSFNGGNNDLATPTQTLVTSGATNNAQPTLCPTLNSHR